MSSLSRTFVEKFCGLGLRSPSALDLAEKVADLQIRGPVSFEFLKRHGMEMPVSPKNSAFKPLGRIGMCYANSARRARRSELIYCEGYAVPKNVGIPLEHAWLCDAQGRVIDPTWREGSDYFGVAFTETFWSNVALETGCYGLLCNLYKLRDVRTKQEMMQFLESGLAQIGQTTEVL